MSVGRLFSRLWLLAAILLVGYPAAAPISAQDSCQGTFVSVSEPLTDLGPQDYVRLEGGPTGFSGGLYPGGSNSRPADHETAGVALAAQIVPLGPAGRPDAGGRIVMISVGMSNTATEFNQFSSLAHRDPEVNPYLALVNGAQGGRTADRWVEADAPTWEEVNNQLARTGVTPAQVQVAWVKQTLVQGGDFPAKAQELQEALEAIAGNLHGHYPNLKIAYFSSRTRSFTYWRGLSPEPLAFETGLAVKWLIEKQVDGDPGLNFDPQKGEVRAPYLAWGPYLWIDGENPRADGRTWTAADMTGDCTHPSGSGAGKVAEMMLEFFKSDTTTVGWFLADTAPPTAVPPTATATAAPLPSATATSAAAPSPAPIPTVNPTARPARTLEATAVAIIPAGPTAAATDQSGAATGDEASLAVVALVAAGLGAGLLWFLARRR